MGLKLEKSSKSSIISSKRESDMNSNEISHKGINRSTEIARSIIKSPDYGRRLSVLGEIPEVQQKIIDESKKALYHRNGTSFEDLIFIHSSTGEMKKNTTYEKAYEVMPTKSMKRMVTMANEYMVIVIHNHPTSSVPSPADIKAMITHKYKYGLVIGHNGVIYKYSSIDDFNEIWYEFALRKLDRNGYSKEDFAVFIEEAKEAGVLVEVI